MDDEEILARGGDMDDIRKYAEQNGADLTEEDVLDEEQIAMEAYWKEKELESMEEEGDFDPEE